MPIFLHREHMNLVAILGLANDLHGAPELVDMLILS